MPNDNYLPPNIIRVISEVTSVDIDPSKDLTPAELQSLKITTILSAWDRQQKQERKIRGKFAGILVAVFIAQIIFISTIIVFIGNGILVFDSWVLNTFIISVFGEMTAMVFWIVKHLFPQANLEILNIIKDL